MKRRSGHIALLFLCLCCFSHLTAQPYTEYELKAAYLFNFGKYVTWPEQAYGKNENSFNIGVYGKNPFGNILTETVKDKSIQGKPVKIIICENTDDAKQCHMLFFSQINAMQAQEVIKTLENKAILTIGDQIEDFCQSGGIINFCPQNYKYRFEINNITAQQQNLIISSKLLALAKIITEDEIKF